MPVVFTAARLSASSGEGQDHELAARELGFPEQALAYVGGSAVTNAGIRDAVASGTQGLLFASPEAVCEWVKSSEKPTAELSAPVREVSHSKT